MIINPIYKREMTVSSRSMKTALIITGFNTILAIVALVSMGVTVNQIELTAEIQYTSFLNIFRFVASIQFVLILFIMPSLTAGSISGERERKTLDLMMTTEMTTADIIIGKLIASLSMIFILVISSTPITALVFVYGGVTISDILLLFLCYFIEAIFIGSIGIYASSICKRTTVSTALTYGFVVLLSFGTIAINLFIKGLVNSSYIQNYSNTDNVSLGMGAYSMLLNPITTFYAVINSMTGEKNAIQSVIETLGYSSVNYSKFNWFAIGSIVQIVLAIIMIVLAIRTINPRRLVKKTNYKNV